MLWWLLPSIYSGPFCHSANKKKLSKHEFEMNPLQEATRPSSKSTILKPSNTTRWSSEEVTVNVPCLFERFYPYLVKIPQQRKNNSLLLKDTLWLFGHRNPKHENGGWRLKQQSKTETRDAVRSHLEFNIFVTPKALHTTKSGRSIRSCMLACQIFF